jgi:hypothetical protein
MSRGQQANTIYLTNPDLDQDECTHLTHQHPEKIPALTVALARTATEPAAIDTGRGPRTLSDEQLEHRLTQIEATFGVPQVEGVASAAIDDQGELLVEYLDLHHEAHDRHRDRLATVAYQPPEWVTDTLGERPSKPDRGAAWDAAVDRALRYRTEHEISDDTPGLLGPEPTSSDVDQRVAWIAARRATENDIRRLRSPEDRGLSAIGR